MVDSDRSSPALKTRASAFLDCFSELGLATQNDVSRLNEGIAAVAALVQPVLLPGQHFAMRAGWGGYDDANVFGFSAAGVHRRQSAKPGARHAYPRRGVGFGTDEGEVAGRAGASFGC